MSSSVFWDRPLTAHQDDIRYSLVLPAASRPSMRIRISLLPKSLASAFDILAPMMFELLTLWMSEGRRGKEKRQRVEKKGWTLLVPTTTRLVALLPLSVALQQPTFFYSPHYPRDVAMVFRLWYVYLDVCPCTSDINTWNDFLLDSILNTMNHFINSHIYIWLQEKEQKLADDRLTPHTVPPIITIFVFVSSFLLIFILGVPYGSTQGRSHNSSM